MNKAIIVLCSVMALQANAESMDVKAYEAATCLATAQVLDKPTTASYYNAQLLTVIEPLTQTDYDTGYYAGRHVGWAEMYINRMAIENNVDKVTSASIIFNAMECQTVGGTDK